jgi:8-oxo-dGTP pyrophosphatase MutT (NUDIX family)
MNFKSLLSEELRKPLPGSEFQLKMTSQGRSRSDSLGEGKKNAAVALVLYKNKVNAGIEMLLVKRTEYKGHHSGQVSFPGGKADRIDSDLLDTAIRETAEETGIHLCAEDMLGKLSPIDIPVSGFRVQPFVFHLSDIPEFRPDPQEVSYLIHFNIELLLDRSVIHSTEFVSGGVKIRAPYYAIAGEVVWGATSMILAEFAEILRRIKTKNSGQL